MIYDAVLRQHREDVVAFLHRKRSQGQISDEDLSKILAEGVIKSDPVASEDYARAAMMMLTLALRLHPELSDEVEETFFKPRGRSSGDRGPP